MAAGGRRGGDTRRGHRALSAIDRPLSSGRGVLVACRAGQSRSASLVIGYLSLQGYDWESAYGLERRAGSVHIRELSEVLVREYPRYSPSRISVTASIDQCSDMRTAFFL